MNTPEQDPRTAEQRFEDEARRLLRTGAAQLDAATASRLNRARQRALEELDTATVRRAWAGWQPALGAAAVVALAVALWLGPEPPPAGPPAAGEEAALDLELMLADENLELIEELEFYDWLAVDGGVAQDDPGVSG